ncbi:MAG: OmpH family outer membrane protein [Chitinophagales bacterium]|nr:OmpH family outer membrane protein [Chitinophagales bacterium]
MKKLLLASFLAMTSSLIMGQKYCIVDVEYVLSRMQQYKDAQAQIDKLAEEWQKEVENRMKDVDAAYRKFQAEQVLITEQMKQHRIKEIENKERDIKEFQRAKFGPNGELFKKREELIKPLQEKFYSEIKKYAEAKGYDLILDKATGPTILYYNEKINKTEDILMALGLNKPAQTGGDGSGSSGASKSTSGGK